MTEFTDEKRMCKENRVSGIGSSTCGRIHDSHALIVEVVFLYAVWSEILHPIRPIVCSPVVCSKYIVGSLCFFYAATFVSLCMMLSCCLGCCLGSGF